MSESGRGTSGNWWKTPLLDLLEKVRQREDQVFLVLTLVIGALTGLAVVGFILLTERLGMRLYPQGAAPVATSAVPSRGLFGHRISAVSLFSQRARQRSTTDQSCAVCTRRPHSVSRYGRGVRWHRARPHDISVDDFLASSEPCGCTQAGRRCDPARCSGFIRCQPT